jgi:hypothetical protein
MLQVKDPASVFELHVADLGIQLLDGDSMLQTKNPASRSGKHVAD